MKVLVIPDIHLKPWIFERASEHLCNKIADSAVCLMDIADDWNRETDIELYKETYDAAIDFAKKYPETMWCFGNHDICYLINQRESGYSPYAAYTVTKKLHELEDALVAGNEIKIIHKIDNVIFCHGGLADVFVKYCVEDDIYDDPEKVIEYINNMPKAELWNQYSPIWVRPQYDPYTMYKADQLLQVVGHTPTDIAFQNRNVISCDAFSTYRSGKSIGDNKFVVIDTKTWEWETV